VQTSLLLLVAAVAVYIPVAVAVAAVLVAIVRHTTVKHLVVAGHQKVP
jgi:hypothetical protein